MSRSIGKKGTAKHSLKIKRKAAAVVPEILCLNCSQDLSAENSRVLFVEEEVGRVFCKEACIAEYFSPEIQRLEKDYFKRLSSSDLSDQDRKTLADLRWTTLEKPEEIWREKTLSGDLRFTLIREYKRKNKQVWSVCICLFLRGEPSFLYLAFPTCNSSMVTCYRRGERVQHVVSSAETDERKKITQLPLKESRQIKPEEMMPEAPSTELEDIQLEPAFGDGLASNWTEEETLRAQLIQERQEDDIPGADYPLYQACVNETLETPDEVWSLQMTDASERLFHFIRFYEAEDPPIWYVVVAKETEDEEGMMILDTFPTRDSNLVELYRKGEQQLGLSESQPMTRVVH